MADAQAFRDSQAFRESLLADGACGRLIASRDWSATPLGPIEAWPQSLRTATSLLLASRVPMVMLWGEDGIMLYNDAYSLFAGGRHPQLLGSKVREGWPEVADFNDNVMRVGLAGGTLAYEDQELTLHRHGRPEQVWMDLDYSPVRDESGRPAGVLCVLAETTQHVAAERELKASEARFRLMADAVPQIVWITDAGGRPEFFNKQWSDYTGATYEPATATDLSADVSAGLVHPDDAAATVAVFEEARRTGSTFRMEHRIRSASGEYRWFLVRAEPYRDPATGAVARWFGASVDIHDRRRAEARLREMNETLEAQVAARSAERDRLWNLSQDMLARADYSGMMSAVSPAWTEVLGWSQAELLSRGYASFMHADDMPPTLAAIGRMSEARAPTRFENRIATRDGGWKHIEWTVAPEPDGVNFIAVGRDVSLTRAREAELAAAQEALRQSQKMEAMGQLTGGVAHDFNNLLTPIVGALDMLQNRGVGGAREQRLIAGAMQSAERAKTLVQRLLAFARRQPLQPVPVDVVRLVTAMGDLAASTMGPQIRVVIEASEALPPAKADPNQLEMALLNLAVNARDAMPDGGTLRISVGTETVGAGHRSALRPGTYIRLSVADTGAGMDEATLARAIEPFFSTKGVGKGTGLGLSMVHGLASQLGGALAIRSRPGLGTNVELWLPRSSEAPEAPAYAAESAEGPLRRGIALLVDDEELARASTADMLSELGYAVIEAASGEDAMRLVDRGERFDLLVTDHLMPGITGTDLARAVRGLRPGVPVLLVSGYAESDGVAADLPRLAKPFRKGELAASLTGLANG